MRDLSKHVGIAIPTIHHRISNMESLQQIVGCRTRIGLNAMGATVALIIGRMTGKLDETMLTKIRSQGTIGYLTMEARTTFW